MDRHTQQELAALNTAFYRANAESFSTTRAHAWTGWQRCAKLIEDYAARALPSDSSDALVDAQLSVLDVGCGNMRFEKFLIEALPQISTTFYTLDNCSALIPVELPQAAINHSEADITGQLIDGTDPLEHLNVCDISCCFGVLHHVPEQTNRTALVRSLIEHTKPGGIAIVSLWRFMDVPALASKATSALKKASTDKTLSESLRFQLMDFAQQNDYLLGWQQTDTWRYCHSFTESEINELIVALSSQSVLVERFRADGKTNNANEYLVFKRKK